MYTTRGQKEDKDTAPHPDPTVSRGHTAGHKTLVR